MSWTKWNVESAGVIGDADPYAMEKQEDKVEDGGRRKKRRNAGAAGWRL
jgi:hypothetical protein